MDASYAKRYRTLWERHWWWRSREAFLMRTIQRINRRVPCRRILDIGCGDGLFFDALSTVGEVFGLEPDPTLVQSSRWRSRIARAALGADFQGDSDFDLALLLDVLEHIEDDDAAIRSAATALRPGGSLVVTVPAVSWLWSQHDVANQHHRRYDRRRLKNVLQRSGLQVETLRFFFFWTVVPLALRRVLAPAARGAADYGVPIPPAPVNAALQTLSWGDHWLGDTIPWPIGTSLLAVARKPERRPTADVPGADPVFSSRAVALHGNVRKIVGPSHSPATCIDLR